MACALPDVQPKNPSTTLRFWPDGFTGAIWRLDRSTCTLAWPRSTRAGRRFAYLRLQIDLTPLDLVIPWYYIQLMFKATIINDAGHLMAPEKADVLAAEMNADVDESSVGIPNGFPRKSNGVSALI